MNAKQRRQIERRVCLRLSSDIGLTMILMMTTWMRKYRLGAIRMSDKEIGEGTRVAGYLVDTSLLIRSMLPCLY